MSMQDHTQPETEAQRALHAAEIALGDGNLETAEAAIEKALGQVRKAQEER